MKFKYQPDGWKVIFPPLFSRQRYKILTATDLFPAVMLEVGSYSGVGLRRWFLSEELRLPYLVDW
jgi:hypothetical protein